jgi:hypothetical protein
MWIVGVVTSTTVLASGLNSGATESRVDTVAWTGPGPGSMPRRFRSPESG